MTHETPPAGPLMMTEGEQVPPPGPTVPEPPGSQRGAAAAAKDDGDFDALLEVKRLAERVGGLEKLREMVDVLGRLRG